MEPVGVLESYPRKVAVGDSLAVLGPTFALAVLRVDTAGADAVVAWVDAQDACEPIELAPLPDGRWAVLLRRCYTKQSRRDALDEHLMFALAKSATR